MTSYIKAIYCPSFSQPAKKYLKTGNAKFHDKDYALAIIEYTIAIETKPDYIDAYFRRANPKDKLKEYTEAIIDYDKAIELSPDFLKPIKTEAKLNII